MPTAELDPLVLHCVCPCVFTLPVVDQSELFIAGKELEVVVDVNTVVCCVVVLVVAICSMTVSVYCVVVSVSSKPPFSVTSVFVTTDVTVLDVTVPPLGPVSPTLYCCVYASNGLE